MAWPRAVCGSGVRVSSAYGTSSAESAAASAPWAASPEGSTISRSSGAMPARRARAASAATARASPAAPATSSRRTPPSGAVGVSGRLAANSPRSSAISECALDVAARGELDVLVRARGESLEGRGRRGEGLAARLERQRDRRRRACGDRLDERALRRAGAPRTRTRAAATNPMPRAARRPCGRPRRRVPSGRACRARRPRAPTPRRARQPHAARGGRADGGELALEPHGIDARLGALVDELAERRGEAGSARRGAERSRRGRAWRGGAGGARARGGASARRRTAGARQDALGEPVERRDDTAEQHARALGELTLEHDPLGLVRARPARGRARCPPPRGTPVRPARACRSEPALRSAGAPRDACSGLGLRRRRRLHLRRHELVHLRDAVAVRVVDLDERLPLVGHRVLGEDRLDRALGLAGAAVDALLGIDHEHAVGLVDAVDGADVDAGLVLHIDAGLGDDVCHLGVAPELEGS